MKIIIKESKIKLLKEIELGKFPNFTYSDVSNYNDTGWKSRIASRTHDVSGDRMFSPDYMKDEYGWHGVRDMNARCFLYKLNSDYVLIGEPGKSHRYTYYEKYAADRGYPNFVTYIGINKRYFSEVDVEIKQDIMKERFIEGRIWVNDKNNVSFAFWELPSSNSELVKVINKILSELNLPTYVVGSDNNTININIGLENKVINLDDMFNNYDSVKETERTIKPDMEKEKQIHLMKQQDKRKALEGFRKAKENKLGKQLSSYDEDGNFKSEMPLAQWRALHSTSENKINGKKIIKNE